MDQLLIEKGIFDYLVKDGNCDINPITIDGFAYEVFEVSEQCNLEMLLAIHQDAEESVVIFVSESEAENCPDLYEVEEDER